MKNFSVPESVSFLNNMLFKENNPQKRSFIKTLIEVKKHGEKALYESAHTGQIKPNDLYKYLWLYQQKGLKCMMISSEYPEDLPEVDTDTDIPTIPTQRADSLMKISHYISNYLEIPDLLFQLIYILLDDKRKFTVSQGIKVSELMDFEIIDILKLVCDEIKPAASSYDTELRNLITDALLEAGLNSGQIDTLLFMVHGLLDTTIDEINDGNYDDPILYFQIKLMIQWYTVFNIIDSMEPYITTDNLIIISNILKSFKDTVNKIFDYEFDDLNIKIPLSEGTADTADWTLMIKGEYQIKLPENSDDFFYWTLSPYPKLTAELEFIKLTTNSKIIVKHKKNNGKIKKYEFTSSVGDITIEGLQLTAGFDPSLSGTTSHDFAPYHVFKDVFNIHTDDGAADNVFSQIRMDNIEIKLEASFLTVLIFPGLLISNKEGIEDLLEKAIEQNNNFFDINSMLRPYLEKFAPNTTAVYSMRIKEPFTSEKTLITFDGLTTNGSQTALNIYNYSPTIEQDDPDSDIDFPDDIDFPHDTGPLDELQPILLDFSNDANFRKISEIKETEKLPKELGQIIHKVGINNKGNIKFNLAAALLNDGFTFNEIALINKRTVDFHKKTFLNRKVRPALLNLVRKVNTEGDIAMIFENPDEIKGILQQGIAEVKRKELEGNLQPVSATLYAPSPCTYEDYSTLDLKRGNCLLPNRIGYSINCCTAYNVFKLLVKEMKSFDIQSNINLNNNAYQYKFQHTGSQRFTIDFSGNSEGFPYLKIYDLDLQVSGNQEFNYNLKIEIPLRPIKIENNCLGDTAIEQVVKYRNCIAELMDSAGFSDETLVNGLLFRYFIFLQLNLDEPENILITNYENNEENNPEIDESELVSLIQNIGQEAFATILNAPILFDPYYFLKTELLDYQADTGWLNIYASYPIQNLLGSE